MKGIAVVSIAVSVALGAVSGGAARAGELVDISLPAYTGVPRPPLKPWTDGPHGNVVLHDDFNRPDGPLGPNWTDQASSFAIVSQAAVGGPASAFALATHNTATGDVIEIDIAHTGASAQYAAAVLNYGGGVSNIFLKVQDNGNNSQFDTAACYTGNNDGGGAFGLGFFALTAPFTTAHMRVEVDASRTVTIDFTNVNGGAGAQQYICPGAPPAEGPAVGMGGWQALAAIDNFSSGVVPVELMSFSVE